MTFETKIAGSVWPMVPTANDARPAYLADWQCFEVQPQGRPASMRRFVECMPAPGKRDGVAALSWSLTLHFGFARPRPGMCIRWAKRTRFTLDGMRTCNQWKSISRAAEALDVSAEVKSLMEIK